MRGSGTGKVSHTPFQVTLGYDGDVPLKHLIRRLWRFLRAAMPRAALQKLARRMHPRHERRG